MPCKNAEKPCPGCRKHTGSPDPRMMFLRPEDFEAPELRAAPRREDHTRLSFAT